MYNLIQLTLIISFKKENNLQLNNVINNVFIKYTYMYNLTQLKC